LINFYVRIAYVEFYTPESVLLAMALSGTQLMGQTIMIQASQAEKNRAAAASKYKKEADRGPDGHSGAGTLGGRVSADQKKDFNTKVYVGGLIDVLNQVSESEIRQWFSPFGDIDRIELPKDPVTGKNKGHAIIDYSRHRDAKNATKEMDGFDVLGRKLSCKIITEGSKPVVSMMQQQANKDLDLEEDSGQQYIHSAQSRLMLMQKLSRGESSLPGDSGQAIKSANFTNNPVASAMMTQVQPSNCILLTNMFDPDQVDLRKDPAFFIDIKEQVEDICREMEGRVEKVWVEQNSPGNVWIRLNKADLRPAQ